MLFSITLAIFCINHLYYSIFASPIVFEGGVSAGQLLNLAHSLVKRVDIPTDMLCDSPAHWASRACVTGLSDREWEDTCISDDGDIYWRMGECPYGTMCQNTSTQDSTDDVPVETVSCIRRPQQNRLVAPDEQSGVYAASDTGTAGPSRRTVTVTVETNLVDATVSGLVEGTDANYVIASSIAATLRGTTTKLCNYNETNLDCVPVGRHTFKAGDAIDFTFVFAGLRDVFLYYAIIAPTKLS